MDEVDTIVVGAGVVGLAVARQMAISGHEVIVLERNQSFGMEVSSRNSEVIHGGIYYRPGSRMAELCVSGNRDLYAYCAERAIPHRRCGKLIVATQEAEEAVLDSIAERACHNGVSGLRRITGSMARELEPALTCSSALLSPATGIIDTHAYMQSLQGDAENHGAAFAYRCPVLGGSITGDGIVLEVGGEHPLTLRCRRLVNAAALGATEFARHLHGYPTETVPALHYAKGNYFGLQGSSPFSRLIYPVPVRGGLGVHLTLDLGGRTKFGPDVEWIDSLDYDVDPRRAKSFYAAVRRYWPGLPDDSLYPDYAGVRPKITARGEEQKDFLILGPEDHGVEGLVHLFGIESPGLTSSLPLARLIEDLLR